MAVPKVLPQLLYPRHTLAPFKESSGRAAHSSRAMVGYTGLLGENEADGIGAKYGQNHLKYGC